MPRISAKQTRTRLKIAAQAPDSEASGEAAPADCPLCGRPLVPGPSVDEHHLVPKSRRGRDKFLVHRVCHTKIHATLSAKELADHYNTWEALRAMNSGGFLRTQSMKTVISGCARNASQVL